MSVADPKCFVRLEEPIPGIDHIKYVDHRAFANAHGLIDSIASQLGVDRINDFYVYRGERGSEPARWHAAADGLEAIRAVKNYLESHPSLPDRATDDYRRQTLGIVAQLETLLTEADCRDIRFCIVGNY
jgi:hypothetical protein